jgi:hypothetical protein
MAIPWLSCIPAAARWLWGKIRGRPTVEAHRGAVVAAGDEAAAAQSGGPIVGKATQREGSVNSYSQREPLRVPVSPSLPLGH